MDAFLGGIYEPCDMHPGRYTYTEGSTVGGAVLYEDGLFLYSHHATDPAGGRLCNAFDLVGSISFMNLIMDQRKERRSRGFHPFLQCVSLRWNSQMLQSHYCRTI